MIVNVQRIDKQNKGLTNRTKEINRKTNNRNCRYYKIQKGILAIHIKQNFRRAYLKQVQ